MKSGMNSPAASTKPQFKYAVLVHKHERSAIFLNNSGIPNRVVHRVAIFDSQGQVSDIISQLDLIK